MRSLGRRAGGAVALAVASALALAACSTGAGNSESGNEDQSGTAASGDVVRLSYWGWIPGLEDAVAAWNSANPDIQVDFFRMTGDDGDKIPTAIDSGSAPDIVQFEAPDAALQVINNRLTDISQYTDSLTDQFPESAWSNVTFGDAVYGIPQDSGPSALMYRSDIFEAANIAVPTTWDEYLQAARDLKAHDPNVRIAQLSPNEAGFWSEDIIANGGTWFSIADDAWKVSVNDAASQEVAKVWQTLLDEDLVKVVEMWTPEYWASINDGSIASINYAAWFPVILEENAPELSGKWAVAPSPTFGTQTAGWSGGSVGTIPVTSKHVPEAVEFLTWLSTSEEGVKFLIDNTFPAANIGLESPDLLVANEYFGGQVINEVFSQAAADVPTGWTPGPTNTLVKESIKDQFAKVANGQQTFSEALDAAQAQAIKDVESLGLNVVE